MKAATKSINDNGKLNDAMHAVSMREHFAARAARALYAARQKMKAAAASGGDNDGSAFTYREASESWRRDVAVMTAAVCRRRTQTARINLQHSISYIRARRSAASAHHRIHQCHHGVAVGIFASRRIAKHILAALKWHLRAIISTRWRDV